MCETLAEDPKMHVNLLSGSIFLGHPVSRRIESKKVFIFMDRCLAKRYFFQTQKRAFQILPWRKMPIISMAVFFKRNLIES
uniref:Uncharacterized protein n=1 Tax=Panagrolaimus sp. ES5 TaxID=591445 RepID=A0AC34FIE8_9BILA